MVEENVLKMVPNRLAYEHMSGNQGFFEDKYVFYRFCFDFDAQCEDGLAGDQQTVDNFNFALNETSSISIERAESEILHCLTLLSKLSPGSMFRKILQKRPEESESDSSIHLFFCMKNSYMNMIRPCDDPPLTVLFVSRPGTADEIDLVYMQLMHVKPLSSLSNSIRQELARVVQYELHRKAQSIGG